MTAAVVISNVAYIDVDVSFSPVPLSVLCEASAEARRKVHVSALNASKPWGFQITVGH